MDIHYNAFISYRHHPDDIRVASQIHRLLEHYRVPRAIRQKSGGITRLFRDKEELPITSNLTDDITRALENSDYLIVICSTHTRESAWVQREIETFLKTHDRSKILTVLADGEPYDTIPEILLHEKRVDPVTGTTEMVDIEPLSCDWRMSLRQAKREELPRLVAALLGCGYDELRRRERQYRTRRMVAFLSAALAATLCFAGYVMYNSMRIQEANDQLEIANGQLENANAQLADANTNLENANAEIRANLNEALVNQSQYLASAADKLLDEGDRMTAIALALEALPEYEGERPYVTDAEYALSTALGLYEPHSSIKAVSVIRCDAPISDFVVTESGDILYILDQRNVVTVWDAETVTLLGSANLSFTPDKLMVTGDGNLVLLHRDAGVVCYDQTGTLQWSYSGNCTDIAFLGDKETLMISRYEVTANYSYVSSITFLASATGAQMREDFAFPEQKNPIFLQDSYISGRPVTVKYYNGEHYSACALDLDSGISLRLVEGMEIIDRAAVTADGNVVVLVSDEITLYNGTVGTLTYISEDTETVMCFDGHTGELLWSADCASYGYSAHVTLETVPGGSDILCQVNNHFLLLDSTTGEIKASGQSPDTILWTRVREDRTYAILKDGSICHFVYDSNYCMSGSQFNGSLSQVEVGKYYYSTGETSAELVVYDDVSDENWRAFEGGRGSYANEWHSCGDLIALECTGAIKMYDGASRALLWDHSCSGGEILGFSGDGSTLWATSRYGDILLRFDVRTGAVTETALPSQIGQISLDIKECSALVGNRVFYLARRYFTDQMYLVCWDADTEETRSWELFALDPDFSGLAMHAILAVTEDYALVWDNSCACVFELDMTTGTIRTLCTDAISRPAAVIPEDGRYLLGAGTSLRLYSWGGAPELEIVLPDCSAISVCCHDGQILAVCDDGALYVYDRAGSLLSTTSLEQYGRFYSTYYQTPDFDPSLIGWQFTKGGMLVLNLCRAGNIIDTENWKIRAFVPYCIGYLEGQQVIVSMDAKSGDTLLGTFPLYSTEDIMAMAREALNDFELTAEQRAAYGLD